MKRCHIKEKWMGRADYTVIEVRNRNTSSRHGYPETLMVRDFTGKRF